MEQPSPDEPLLVSACLLGQRCRYDGESKPSLPVSRLIEGWTAAGGRVVGVCPEELGGLPTPRPPADLRGGDGHGVLDGAATVRTVEGDVDVTDAFLCGAKRALEQARSARMAVLKARSPSCGVVETQVEGALRPGDGVFAALLRRRGVELRTEEDL
jgi:uncharacterized protein YbbK (DUF523 family)